MDSEKKRLEIASHTFVFISDDEKKAWSSFPFNRSSACAPSLSPTPLKHSVAKHADYFSCPRRASSKGQMQCQPEKLP